MEIRDVSLHSDPARPFISGCECQAFRLQPASPCPAKPVLHHGLRSARPGPAHSSPEGQVLVNPFAGFSPYPIRGHGFRTSSIRRTNWRFSSYSINQPIYKLSPTTSAYMQAYISHMGTLFCPPFPPGKMWQCGFVSIMHSSWVTQPGWETWARHSVGHPRGFWPSLKLAVTSPQKFLFCGRGCAQQHTSISHHFERLRKVFLELPKGTYDISLWTISQSSLSNLDSWLKFNTRIWNSCEVPDNRVLLQFKLSRCLKSGALFC